MAKKKREKESQSVGATSPAVASAPQVSRGESAPSTDVPLSFRDYILLNVIFDVFCLVQLVLARLFIRETRGLYFFFAMLMIGFFLVSMFDYLYEHLQARAQQSQKTG